MVLGEPVARTTRSTSNDGNQEDALACLDAAAMSSWCLSTDQDWTEHDQEKTTATTALDALLELELDLHCSAEPFADDNQAGTLFNSCGELSEALNLSLELLVCDCVMANETRLILHPIRRCRAHTEDTISNGRAMGQVERQWRQMASQN